MDDQLSHPSKAITALCLRNRSQQGIQAERSTEAVPIAVICLVAPEHALRSLQRAHEKEKDRKNSRQSPGRRHGSVLPLPHSARPARRNSCSQIQRTTIAMILSMSHTRIQVPSPSQARYHHARDTEASVNTTRPLSRTKYSHNHTHLQPSGVSSVERLCISPTYVR